MIITIPYARKQFSHFNELCFGGSLPEVPIVLTRARTYIGKLCYKTVGTLWKKRNSDFKIRLSTLFDLPEETWQDVIIHEMIHLYIASKNLKDSSSHGKLFRGVMADINSRFGRHLVISYRFRTLRDTESNRDQLSSTAHSSQVGASYDRCVMPPRAILVNDRKRTHYVCISTFYDGRKGITVCSEAMARKIDRGLPRCYRLKSKEWYATNDVYFNDFPHSRLPRIYKVKSAVIEQHIGESEKIEKFH